MIICSCTVVTDRDIEIALIEILSEPNAPIPTPGLVYRHLSKRMNCCGCAPLAVSTIYATVERLERQGYLSRGAFTSVEVQVHDPDSSPPETLEQAEEIREPVVDPDAPALAAE